MLCPWAPTPTHISVRTHISYAHFLPTSSRIRSHRHPRHLNQSASQQGPHWRSRCFCVGKGTSIQCLAPAVTCDGRADPAQCVAAAPANQRPCPRAKKHCAGKGAVKSAEPRPDVQVCSEPAHQNDSPRLASPSVSPRFTPG